MASGQHYITWVLNSCSQSTEPQLHMHNQHGRVPLPVKHTTFSGVLKAVSSQPVGPVRLDASKKHWVDWSVACGKQRSERASGGGGLLFESHHTILIDASRVRHPSSESSRLRGCNARNTGAYQYWNQRAFIGGSRRSEICALLRNAGLEIVHSHTYLMSVTCRGLQCPRMIAVAVPAADGGFAMQVDTFLFSSYS